MLVNLPNGLNRIFSTVMGYPFLFIKVFLSGLKPQFVYAPPEIPECSPGLWVLLAIGIIDTAEELKE